ncbi:MAG TPA: DUF1801 domain-containing protein [Candidatus Kapabacteria bacterium]|nr:DUF1801 domain-containing protein [Candidatus Kapabacteria bacterium]
MPTDRTELRNIDEYIAGFPKDIQKILNEIRETIREAAPGAEEAIKYQMPTFTLNGNLVHFAVFKKYIGFYPAPQGVPEFEKELAGYEGTKSSAHFPLDQPIPFGLIRKIVEYRVRRNAERSKEKR